MTRIVRYFLCAAFLVFLAGCAGSAFKEASDADSIEAYENFLKEYPTGKYAKRARERIEEIYYSKARLKNNMQSYREFLERFPESKFTAEIDTYITILEVFDVLSSAGYPLIAERDGEKEEDGAGKRTHKVRFINKTDIPVKMYFVGPEIFNYELAPKEQKIFEFRGATTVVFKDNKRTFPSQSTVIDADGGISELELWLAPDGKYMKRLELIGTEPAL